jgi:hypothetical protein
MTKTNSNKKRIDRSYVDTIRSTRGMPSWEKWRLISELILEDLKSNGQFFKTARGLFYFDSETKRAFPLHKNIQLDAMINSRYGINPQEHGSKLVLANMQSEAENNGASIEIRVFAHYERSTQCPYVSRFNGSVYKLDGSTVAEVTNGTDNVFFLDERDTWEPYTYRPNTSAGPLQKLLTESVNFAESTLSVKEQQLFLELWLLSVFFGSIQPTKIILLLVGQQGSGKTSALRRIQKFLFGTKANLLSIEKEKPDGFIATITSDPIALFDNLDERVSWLPFNLSRLATGVTFTRRRLYTTNDKAEFPGVSWLGITARSADFMLDQPDLPDRTLVLKLDRLNQKRAEEELLCEVEAYRDVMWSELLDDLNRVVRHLQQHPGSESVQFRMADFASTALKIADAWGCRGEVEQGLRKLEGAQAELVLQDDPISLVLELWLGDPSNPGREVDAGKLFSEWTLLAAGNSIKWPFGNSMSLGKRLGQVQVALKQQFEVEISRDTHAKQNRYRFWPKDGQRPDKAALLGADVIEANQPVERVLAEAVSATETAETPRPTRGPKSFEEFVMELYPKR